MCFTVAFTVLSLLHTKFSTVTIFILEQPSCQEISMKDGQQATICKHILIKPANKRVNINGISYFCVPISFKSSVLSSGAMLWIDLGLCTLYHSSVRDYTYTQYMLLQIISSISLIVSKLVEQHLPVRMGAMLLLTLVLPLLLGLLMISTHSMRS